MSRARHIAVVRSRTWYSEWYTFFVLMALFLVLRYIFELMPCEFFVLLINVKTLKLYCKILRNIKYKIEYYFYEHRSIYHIKKLCMYLLCVQFFFYISLKWQACILLAHSYFVRFIYLFFVFVGPTTYKLLIYSPIFS